MRCPSCNKFTGLDNADPEVDDLSVGDIDKGSMEVTVGGRHVRQCAECSTELKSIDFSESESVDLDSFEGWNELTDEEKKKVTEASESGDLTVDIDSADPSAEESGGMRYKKNIITITVGYELTIDLSDVLKEKDKVLTRSGAFTFENAASAYDECC